MGWTKPKVSESVGSGKKRPTEFLISWQEDLDMIILFEKQLWSMLKKISKAKDKHIAKLEGFEKFKTKNGNKLWSKEYEISRERKTDRSIEETWDFIGKKKEDEGQED